jgi:serine protease DegS
MPIPKSYRLAVKTLVAGIIAAMALLYLFPNGFFDYRPVVTLHTSEEQHRLAPSQGPVSYADAVNRAAPAVVNIYTSKTIMGRAQLFPDDSILRRFFGDRLKTPKQQTQISLGSGVIISPQGYVLTNNHVIQDANEIEILLADGKNIGAQVVGVDLETDLAVLRIEHRELPSITIGSSDGLRVGDVVLAIGNPFGVGKTVTQGIISATGRNRLGINTIEDFIQTDAAINPGNSGGALINAYGELVGINTAIFSQSGGSHGIGFAIPVTLAQDIMTQIIETGSVTRGWLGVEVQNISPELAESFGLEHTAGVLIAGVMTKGPAGEADIRPGDIITTINNQSIEDATDALTQIARLKPGDRCRVSGIRDGNRFEIELEVGRRPPMR